MIRRLFPIAAVLAALTFATAHAQVSDRSYPINGANELRLNVSGHLHLMPSATASSISFHAIDYGPALPALNFAQTRVGKRMTVTVTGPSASILPFTGASGYELQVTYPASMKLDLRQFGGDVQVDHLAASTQIYDANGSITVNGASAPITAEADSGSITLTDAHDNVSLTTSDGPVTAQLAAGWHGKLVRIESSNGALSLSVSPGFRGDFDLTSADGAVHNAFRTSKGAPVVFMLTQSGDVNVAAAKP